MRRKLGLISALVGATAVSLLSATSAGAATNLGETFDPPDFCAENTTYLVTDSVGNAYTVPFGGVISRWSFQGGSVPPDSARLKVGRVLSGTDLSAPFTDLSVTGESASESVTANSLNTFSTRVTVQHGDFLGIFLGGDGVAHCSDGSKTGYVDHYSNSDVPAGSSAEFTREVEGQVEVAAVLEPDADHDGFGDETQDQCASNAGTQGQCPVAPKKKKCKKHKKKHKRSAESAKKKKCKKKKRR